MQFILGILKKLITFIQILQVYKEQNWEKKEELKALSPKS